jgi:radical SAM superfamily enzyme with C-terminal helix-hairpin-helix motif
MLKVTILDGYVDEPTCLGVPPYISPYPRYTAGAIISYDIKTEILYVTIDQIRKDKSFLDVLSKSDLIVVIAGMSVPGKYLSGLPISPNEIISILSDLTKPIKVLCGPAASHGFGIAGGKEVRGTDFVKNVFDLIVKGDGELAVFDLLKNRLDVRKVDFSPM